MFESFTFSPNIIGSCRPVNIARYISFGMTALGIVLAVAAVMLDLSPVVALTGMLMFVAGFVKIGMVVIWQTMFRLPPAGRPESTRVTNEPTRTLGEVNEV